MGLDWGQGRPKITLSAGRGSKFAFAAPLAKGRSARQNHRIFDSSRCVLLTPPAGDRHCSRSGSDSPCRGAARPQAFAERASRTRAKKIRQMVFPLSNSHAEKTLTGRPLSAARLAAALTRRCSAAGFIATPLRSSSQRSALITPSRRFDGRKPALNTAVQLSERAVDDHRGPHAIVKA